MATDDKCCTIVPYFRLPPESLASFKRLCEAYVARARSEPKCLYYGFSFCDDLVHCREGYADAEGVLAHVANVREFFKQALKVADLVRLEVHGPEGELAKLRQPLAEYRPQFFVLEYGFRR